MTDLDQWLRRHERKDLLRFVTIGSVDDGKSTLIGRLLHDANGLFDDQLAAVKRASTRSAHGTTNGHPNGHPNGRPNGHPNETDTESDIDFSLVTDGLKAEREQGITIDVAYRYFATDKRKYILADTPGHVQYTRNMATGASTADVALVLIDARLGVLAQSRRHAAIAALLGIRQLLVVVNKMDLVGWSHDTFDRHRSEFMKVTAALGFERTVFVPVCARSGDNVVKRSVRSPWHDGPTVLSFLEETPLGESTAGEPLRFPVQYVLRPDLDYRGFAGTVASGTVRVGDSVTVLPSGRRTTVSSIDTYEGAIDMASAPMAVTLRLTDAIDVSRGDVIAHPGHEPIASQHFEADIIWLDEDPMVLSRPYLVQHTTRMVSARFESVLSKLDLDSLREHPASGLELNDLGRVVLRCERPIFADPYAQNRATGAFIVVDPISNNTAAAGMFRASHTTSAGERIPRSTVTTTERAARNGHRAAVVLLANTTPQSVSAIERALFDRECLVTIVDEATLGAVQSCIALGALGAIILCRRESFSKTDRDHLRIAKNDRDIAVIEIDMAHGESVVTVLEKQGIIAGH